MTDALYADILVATDGSNRADRAADYGIELAAGADATVHALYVVDERRYGETPALSTEELAVEQFEDEGERFTEDIAERARDRGLDAETVVTRGRPYEQILATAQAVDADTIVLGRAGADQAEMPHVGAITDRVLRSTDTPVFPV